MSEPRYSKYFFILGEPIPKWKVYVSVASVLILVTGGAGFLYYMMLKNRSAVRPAAPAAVTTVTEDAARVAERSSSPGVELGSARVTSRNISTRSLMMSEARTPLERLLEQHMEATGFDQVNSYLVEGSVGVDGHHEIVLIARAPNLYKYKTKYTASGGMIEFGYEGSGSWLGGSDIEISRGAAEYYTSLALLEGSLTHLAWSYLSSDASEYGLASVLELQPSETWNGRSCAVVLSHGILPIPMYHYIDSETFRELYRRAKLTNLDGDLVEVGIRFDPPDESLHATFPKGYELYVDGKMLDDVAFSKLRLDRVILSSLFDPPANSAYVNLAPAR
ncbi:hypothetical protein SH580_13060 [Coraliomargarita algicola]|uniref:Uncharacterized protein n=1 Tax=Coraliomargarita algicola TaxID=3092156 RepID=A0ABZ0RH27_9BACT|nr:hypothetical protein [Coraliomargarita sp. J2-16]WPJ94363.1 hypothetical protein SH580_13060 [Coraliomargarita sp. J2-16]